MDPAYCRQALREKKKNSRRTVQVPEILRGRFPLWRTGLANQSRKKTQIRALSDLDLLNLRERKKISRAKPQSLPAGRQAAKEVISALASLPEAFASLREKKTAMLRGRSPKFFGAGFRFGGQVTRINQEKNADMGVIGFRSARKEKNKSRKAAEPACRQTGRKGGNLGSYQSAGGLCVFAREKNRNAAGQAAKMQKLAT